jgi:hypothetical protein
MMLVFSLMKLRLVKLYGNTLRILQLEPGFLPLTSHFGQDMVVAPATVYRKARVDSMHASSYGTMELHETSSQSET